MNDRQPKYPGRVKLRNVSTGVEETYDLTMADEPSVEGDAPTKGNLLQDITCDVIGIPRSSVVNDALLKLSLGIGKFGYAVTVRLWDGTPVRGATLVGLTAPNGSPAVTDEYGLAVGVSESQSVTFSIVSTLVDVNGVSGETIVSTGIVTEHNVVLTRIDLTNTPITTSNVYKFSDIAETVDITAVGGGGGSGSGLYGGGGGGGGGFVATKLGISLATSKQITVSVGAGAESTTNGGTEGGATVVSQGGIEILRANGGKNGGSTGSGSTNGQGGIGNGNGGTGGLNANDPKARGKDGTGFKFDDPKLGLAGGGGGAGYPNASVKEAAPGGLPNGGSSKNNNPSGIKNGAPLGGGAGGVTYEIQSQTGGGRRGGSGGVFFRPHYKGE